MSAFEEWYSQTYETARIPYAMEKESFAGGRKSMKADILRLFSADLLSRDISLMKIMRQIEEMQ